MLSLITSGLLLAQGPVCGGLYGTTPENSLFTGCFIPSGRGDGSGAQIRIDPIFSPSGYRATPVPPTTLPTYQQPTAYPVYRQ